MSIVYLDTETTGLDPQRHEVWEIAWAVEGLPIQHAFMSHSGVSADINALSVGGYHERWPRHVFDFSDGRRSEQMVLQALKGATLCAANPAFDSAFLIARWGQKPWLYRMLDIEAYAMGALGYPIPRGLKDIAADLTDRGHDIPTPDHTAAGDVATLRACHYALQGMYAPQQSEETT